MSPLPEKWMAALRESGDIVMAIAEGSLNASSLLSLFELVNTPKRIFDQPRFFKSSGMAWEDLAVAAEVFRRSGANH
jgi:ornithine cyclodeaminase/alanine dehydrogenase-like protein (mu-crystallin family)